MKEYTFNRVFRPECEQEEMYKGTTEPLVDALYMGRSGGSPFNHSLSMTKQHLINRHEVLWASGHGDRMIHVLLDHTQHAHRTCEGSHTSISVRVLLAWQVCSSHTA